jgi:hypothetical protein
MPSGDSKTTSSNVPWSGELPYLQGQAANPKRGTPEIPGIMPLAAQQYLSNKPSYFASSTIQPWSAEQNQAAEMGATRAAGGSPLNAAASAEALRTLNGDYLSGGSGTGTMTGNPALDAIRNLGMRDASAVASRFGAGGRTGSGAMQDSIAQGYSAATAPYFFSAHENERGRMADAMHFAPQLAAEDYRDIDYLNAIGARRQAQGQAELTDEVNRHNFEQTIDAQKLQQYADLIRGVSGGFGTTVGTTPGPSPFQTLAGLLLGGAGVAGGLGWQPFGAPAAASGFNPALMGLF